MLRRHINILSGVVLAGVLLSLVACSGSRPLEGNGDLVNPDSVDGPPRGSKLEDYVEVEVFYGTDRARTGSAAPNRFYGGGRGTFEVGTCIVSIPRGHQVGHVERPTWKKFEFREDPARHVVLLQVNPMEQDAMFQQLSATVDWSGEKALLVFIHGFNVTFEQAAHRAAQLAYDLPYAGVPVFYSWPSNGNVTDYPDDETDVEWTVPHLHGFLQDLVERTGAQKINLIAHSMGNRALAAALRAIAAESEAPVFNEVILTAPDIDAEVFARDIAPAIRPVAERITLYASANDWALHASEEWHGYPRAGDAGDGLVIVDGIDTIDASTVETSLLGLGHSYFAETEPLLSDLYTLLHRGGAPDERRLRQERFGDKIYWLLR